MKVSPANVLLALTLLIIFLVSMSVIRTRIQASPTPLSQKVQPIRIQASVSAPSPLAPTIPSTVTAPTPITPIFTKPDQYRAWMAEARTQYPYDESLDIMWSVMLCESSGNADVVADIYYGLFQYNPTTWGGDWNPYRDLPILDPHAQIFATAKAWHEGHQHWWGCYPN